MSVLQYTDVERAARDVVRELGELKYYERCDLPNYVCFYVEPEVECPSCVVGRILHRLGVPLHVLRKMDEATSFSTEDSGISGRYALQTLEQNGFTFEDDVSVNFLEVMQLEQDTGSTYGRALERALKAVDLRIKNDELKERND